MDSTTKHRLLEKNRKLIDMVIEKAKKDFPDDIAAVGLIGSFTTNEYHEKSDLDLIIINNNDNAWGIARCFIFDDVGYDFYCTSWDKIPTLTHMEVYYCSKPEYQARVDRLIAARQRELSEPIGQGCLERAVKPIDLAKQKYADVMLADDISAVRYASGTMLDMIIEAVSELNNKVIRKYGLRKCLETLLSFTYLPEEFEKHYVSLIDAKEPEVIKQSSFQLLRSLVQLYDRMCLEFLERPVPTYDNLRGTYEELWCNYRNKVLRSTALHDTSYAFLIAVGAQGFFDEMTATIGTKKIDVMRHFDSENLDTFRDRFLDAMDAYLLEYTKVGRTPEKYDTFEELFSAFMGRS